MEIQRHSALDQQNQYAEVLGQIKDKIIEGKEPALFIGRQPKEELPDNIDTLFWISLDVGDEGPAVEKSRIHLKLSINDRESLQIFNGLFKKVVVDQSTWKFFDGESKPIDRLTKLLDKSKPNELIFESHFQFPAIGESYSFNQVELVIPETELNEYGNQLSKFWEHYTNNTSERDQENDFLAFLETEPIYKKHYEIKELTKEDLSYDFKSYIQRRIAKEKGIISPYEKFPEKARKETVEHLKILFTDVSLIRDRQYPYPTRYDNGTSDYYIAQNTKNT